MAENDERLKALLKDTQDRIKACKSEKHNKRLDIREAYFFAAPHREREVAQIEAPGKEYTEIENEQGELMTGLGIECAQDFGGHVLHTFMPSLFPWAKRGPGMYVSEDDWQEVKDDVEAQDSMILKAIRSAGFDAQVFQTFNPDLAVGTVGLLVDDSVLSQAPVLQPVPISEMLLACGPFGLVDDRFIVRRYKASKLMGVLGKDIYDKLDKATKESTRDVVVHWGWWRIWDDPAVIKWQHVVMCADKIVHDEVLEGRGSCKFIVARWNPDPNSPWGNGPQIATLPWFRVLDQLSEATYESGAQTVMPPFGYPDDGVVNFEGGIENGKAYPMAPGSGNDFVPLVWRGGSELTFYTLQDLERSIKRQYYLDRPEQVGKTPPTATQWLDDLIESQRRIGPVGQKFWMEFAAELFVRFQYILESRGVIEPVRKGEATVALEPYNPAIKSQEMQEVRGAFDLVGALRTLFPEESQVIIDGPATIENIKKKAKDEIVVLRDAGRVEEIIKNGAALLGAMQGGGQPPGGAGA